MMNIPTRQKNRGKTFLTFETLPQIDPYKEGQKLNPLYETLFSDHLKEAALILLLNEIRGSNPESDSNERNRAVLAKAKTLAELVDLEAILIKTQEHQETIRQDELPESTYSDEEPDSVL